MIKQFKNLLISLNICFVMSICHSTEISNCDSLLYGIGVKKNTPEAYDCYIDKQNYISAIIIILNRPFEPKNINEINELIEQWTIASKWEATKSKESEQIRYLLQEYKLNKKPSKPIDFCQDIAHTTISENYCISLQLEIIKAKFQSETEKPNLSTKSKTAQNKVIAAFDNYVKNMSDEEFMLNLNGSIRAFAALDSQIQLITHFRKTYEEVVINRLQHQARLYWWRDEQLVQAIVTKKVNDKTKFIANNPNDEEDDELLKELIKQETRSQLAWKKFFEEWKLFVQTLIESNHFEKINQPKERIVYTTNTMLLLDRLSDTEFNRISGDAKE